jgi:hypothetical protein
MSWIDRRPFADMTGLQKFCHAERRAVIHHKGGEVIVDSSSWRSLVAREFGVCRPQPYWDRLFVFDQERRNASLDCLSYAVLRSLARANRPMQCDAEIRTWLDELSIPRTDRWGPGLSRVCHRNFNGDTQVLARDIERLVDPP